MNDKDLARDNSQFSRREPSLEPATSRNVVTARIYARGNRGAGTQTGAAAGHEYPRSMNDPVDNQDNVLDELIRGAITMRRIERDLHLIATDPTKLAGYHQLSPEVRALAKTDPMTFWAAWQLAQAGISFDGVDGFQENLQKNLDDALAAAGWDEKSPPTDELFRRAEIMVKQRMYEQYVSGK